MLCLFLLRIWYLEEEGVDRKYNENDASKYLYSAQLQESHDQSPTQNGQKGTQQVAYRATHKYYTLEEE